MKSGVNVFKYVIAPTEFQSYRIYPPNKCYCTGPKSCRSGSDNIDVDDDGFIDLSPCYVGIPLYASRPYFHNSPAKTYSSAIQKRIKFVDHKMNSSQTSLDNNNDNEDNYADSYDEDRNYLLIHPLFGTTVHGRLNIQLSLRLSNQSKFDLFRPSLDNSGGEYQIPFVHFWKVIHMNNKTGQKLRTVDWLLTGFVSFGFCLWPNFYVHLYGKLYY